MLAPTNPYQQKAVSKAIAGVIPQKLPPEQMAGAVTRTAIPKPAGVSTEPAKEAAVVKAAGPVMGDSYEPPKTDPVVVRPNATPTPAGVTTDPPKPPPAPTKTAFDLQREQVAADQMAEEARRMEAVERFYSNRGLGDSGILAGAERAERAAVAGEAGRMRSAIGQEESRQAFTASEADKARTFSSTEADKDREITRLGMAQAKELAYAGLDVQKMGIALQEKGMNAEDARFYASLAQADKHAERGFTLEEARIDLQEQGLSQQDAQFYAGLGQARILAERGYDLQATQLALQEKGMSQQDAQFYAGLAHQKDMLNAQTVADIQKGFLAAGLDKVKFDTPEGVKAFNDLLGKWGLSQYALPIPAPAPAAPAATKPTDATTPYTTGRNQR